MASTSNRTVAVAIVCKAPIAGQSKTRLSPPLRPEECAALSACFIRDISNTVQGMAETDNVAGYAVYTPRGSEAVLRPLLPQRFRLSSQSEGDLGARMCESISGLLAAGHAGAILIGADMPTLPISILRDAVRAVRSNDCLVLSPALDGGYTLIGLSRPHAELFADMPWSTSEVYRLTLARARTLGLPVVNVAGWYDVDDAASLRMLTDELSGQRPPFADASLAGADAPASRAFLSARRNYISA
ncbi:MAG: TIGR04282 family arsenosugar biosynthesis glycosyltransferase [Rhizobiales bacterium]|nr:TIGR04282 family arsenosugar biosynthesis glycosyltransferase [Hyphomicrobiales bacterium]